MHVLLSIGSNLGRRAEHLAAALDALARHARIQVLTRSRCYETEPVGKVEQPAFLNLAAEIETDLAPLELLKVVKEIETRLGRTPSERWGPRVIDIDIVLWGDTVLETERLTLPHREFRRRAFVLIPLAEIAPFACDPVTGLTVQELAGRVSAADGWVRPVSEGH